jgi:hypothetical protein
MAGDTRPVTMSDGVAQITASGTDLALNDGVQPPN